MAELVLVLAGNSPTRAILGRSLLAMALAMTTLSACQIKNGKDSGNKTAEETKKETERVASEIQQNTDQTLSDMNQWLSDLNQSVASDLAAAQAAADAASSVGLTTPTLLNVPATKTEASAESRAFASKLKITMLDCPSRVWPNYNWEGLKVVFVYTALETAYIWDTSSNSISESPRTSLPNHGLVGTYNFITFDGKPALAVNMEIPFHDRTNTILGLIIHEFFHNQGQKNWTHSAGATSRGTNYPLSSTPRFYRRMVYDNLANHYLNSGANGEPTTKALQQARYWYDQWTREYPSEVRSTTDGYEGTAKYVEFMGLVVSQLGCEVGESELMAKTAEAFRKDKNFGHAVQGSYFSLDAEGYALGGLSALILRSQSLLQQSFAREQMQKAGALAGEVESIENWTQSVARGHTPLELLLKDVEPLPQEPDPALSAQFETSVRRINTTYGEKIDSDIKNWSDKSYVRVGLPSSWVHTSFSPLFFAHSTDLNRDLYPLATELSYQSPDEKSSFVADALSVHISLTPQDKSPCATGIYSVALVHMDNMTKQPSADGDSLYVMRNGPGGLINGNYAGDIKTTPDGYLFLCPSN